MSRSRAAVALAVVAAAATLVGGESAVQARAQACMEGVDTVKSSIDAEVYCGPASAVVVTKGITKAPIRPGSCIRNLRRPGDFDLYLGTDKGGGGPWPRTLHLYRPSTGKAGLTMESGFAQWTGLSTITVTVSKSGGSFSGTVLYRAKGKTVNARSPIKGTFKCSG